MGSQIALGDGQGPAAGRQPMSARRIVSRRATEALCRGPAWGSGLCGGRGLGGAAGAEMCAAPPGRAGSKRARWRGSHGAAFDTYVHDLREFGPAKARRTGPHGPTAGNGQASPRATDRVMVTAGPPVVGSEPAPHTRPQRRSFHCNFPFLRNCSFMCASPIVPCAHSSQPGYAQRPNDLIHLHLPKPLLRPLSATATY